MDKNAIMKILDQEKIEFANLVRILSGFDSSVKLAQSRQGRIARAMFEVYLAEKYDRLGCFGYVGWTVPEGEDPPRRERQIDVFSAFARGAVAARVYLGSLEPNEGFGLVAWNDDVADPSGYNQAFNRVRDAVAYALDQLAVKPGWSQLSSTRIALGFGRLRGSALFSSNPARMLLFGPLVVQTIYGEIPNRCGGLAKGKDDFSKPGSGIAPDISKGQVMVFRQPWISVQASTASLNQDPVALDCIKPKAIEPDKDLKPFVIGFSLDFAKSQKEYANDPHLARTVIDQILSEFDAITEQIPGLFVSPRFGDGVVAVIVVEATSTQDALNRQDQRWFEFVREFCRSATRRLKGCHELGLRIGMAIDEDTAACAPRLAGVGQTSNPAVDFLASAVIERARRCHAIATAPATYIETRRKASLLWIQPGDVRVQYMPVG